MPRPPDLCVGPKLAKGAIRLFVLLSYFLLSLPWASQAALAQEFGTLAGHLTSHPTALSFNAMRQNGLSYVLLQGDLVTNVPRFQFALSSDPVRFSKQFIGSSFVARDEKAIFASDTTHSVPSS